MVIDAKKFLGLRNNETNGGVFEIKDGRKLYLWNILGETQHSRFSSIV